jgi:LmbE family N-acetylglucosaminyl deacetylase
MLASFASEGKIVFMTDMHFDELKPKVVLGVAAHPDDLDVMAAASMAKWASDGADVYYLILTDGGAGSEARTTTPEKLRDIRREEQRNAGKVLGLKDVFFCEHHDGKLENTLDVKRDVVRAIRKVKPDVVVAFDPSALYSAKLGLINHPDHRAAGQAALDAVFPLARDHMSFPELLRDEGLEPHKTNTVLLMNFNEGNYAVDISDTLEQKWSALAEHVSQVPANLDEAKVYLTERAASAGEKYGFKHAETFVRIDIR